MRGSESHDREFFRAMEMHLEASRLLLDASRDAATTRNHMAIYHAGYAVECALKARFLCTQSPSQQGRVIANVYKKRVKHDTIFRTTCKNWYFNQAWRINGKMLPGKVGCADCPHTSFISASLKHFQSSFFLNVGIN